MAKKVTKQEFKKTAAKRTADISQTQWLGGPKSGMFGFGGPKGNAGRLFGPKGKLFTGTVNLGDGKTAVYKQGKKIKPGKVQAKGPSGPAAPPKPSAATSRVSPSARGEGAGRTRASSARMGAEGPKVSVPRTTSPTGRVPFSRGIGVMAGASSAQKSSRLKRAQAKQRYDRSPAGQRKNAFGLGILATVATGGLAAGSTAAAVSGMGAVAARGAAAGLVSGARSATGQVAARGAAQAAAKKAVTPFKEGVKSVKGTTQGVSKVTGGPLKGGKPVKTGPKKPTAAQAAASRRKAAAQKAAATRRANAAKTARGRKKP